MNFIARAFNRNIGSQASVSSTAVDAQNIVTSNSNDRVDIRAAAFNRRGYAEAIGLDSSSLDTGSGNDRVRISARANGQTPPNLGHARQLPRYRLRQRPR